MTTAALTSKQVALHHCFWELVAFSSISNTSHKTLMSAPSITIITTEVCLTVGFGQKEYLGNDECESYISFQGVDFKIKLVPRYIAEESSKPRLLAFLFAKCSKGMNVDVTFGLKLWSSLPTIYFFAGYKGFAKTELTKIPHDPKMLHEYLPVNSSIILCSNLLHTGEKYTNFIKDGQLSFVIQLKFNKIGFNNSKTWNDTIPTRLYDHTTSDFAIVVGSVRIPCHKLILSLASPVFKAMFESQMQESVTNEIVISDFSEEVMRSFLKYIYSPSAVFTKCESMAQEAQELLLLADKYQMNDLSLHVTNYIIQSINMETVFSTLTYAEQFDQQAIKTAALSFMVKNSKWFLKNSKVLKTLHADLVSEFLSLVADSY